MESLRVMPPVPLTVRKTAKTDYIEGVLVPKGTLLHICVRSNSADVKSCLLTNGIDSKREYMADHLGRRRRRVSKIDGSIEHQVD